MKKNKPTLYIGAHSDDVAIGCSISIHRDSKNAFVFSVTNGAPHETYPAIQSGIKFQSPWEYMGRRVVEDKKAMKLLGVDIDNNYFNGEFNDQEIHVYIPELTELIEQIVTEKGIERIITHEFPQSHPDHEVVSLCSHFVGQKSGIEVWEYPMYGFDKKGKLRVRKFLSSHEKVSTIRYSQEESDLRKKVLECYETQSFIREGFKGEKESFGRSERNLIDLPDSTYFYGDEKGKPKPQYIRQLFSRFFKYHKI